MAKSKTQFEEFLEQEVRESKGLYFPVRTTALERMLTRRTDIHNLHPNPEDEFCMPDIGPNYEIISRYEQQFAKEGCMFGEPIIVERTYPDGYRIINGHHRWAAALQVGEKKVPIRIINLTHGDDIRRILEASAHTKRAALDLDEVVFSAGSDAPTEGPPPFPWNMVYSERIRLGVPALFHCLSDKGYDIWLYSAQYYSVDSIQNFFRKYHVKVDGVITASGKRIGTSAGSGKTVEQMFSDQYRYTIHVDDRSVLQVFPDRRPIQEFPLSGAADSWSHEAVEAIEKMDNPERRTMQP